MTLGQVDTTTTLERDETMAVIETGEEATVRVARQDVAELRGLCPDTAEARRAWARFDAIAGVRWMDDDVFATYSANKGRRKVEWDRPGLMLAMRYDGDTESCMFTGDKWWTDSYRLVREGGERGWQVPPVRGCTGSGNMLRLDEWLSAAEMADVLKAGGRPEVYAVAHAVREVRDMVDSGSRASARLSVLADACEAQSPDFMSLVRATENRSEVQVWPSRLCAGEPSDTVVLEGEGVAMKVNAAYLAAFRGDCELWAHDAMKPVRLTVDGETVGLLMPIRYPGAVVPMLADCDGDQLFMRAVADLASSRLWNGKKMLAQADPRLFELVGRLGIVAGGVR